MNWLIHFIKKRVSLRIFLTIGGIVFTLILIFTFGYTSYQVGRETLIKTLQEAFSKDSHLARTQIQDFISHQNEILQVVQKTPPISAIFRALENGGVDPISKDDVVTWRHRLEQIMISSIDADLDSSLQQLRLLDSKGMELVRVYNQRAGPSRVPVEDLQDKSSRLYFQKAILLNPGESYVSPINLNREYGKIVKPFEPTFRVAIPLFNDEGHTLGVLVSNINPRTIFKRLISHKEIFKNIYLVNQDGDFLIHPDPEKTFGFDRGFEYTLEDEHPNLARQIKSKYEYINRLSSHGEKSPHFDGYVHIYYNPSNHNKYWAFVFDIPIEAVLEPIIELRFNLIVLAVFFSLVFALISYIAGTRFITKPVQDLCKATQNISEGNYKLDIHSGGHIQDFEQLSEAITHMLGEIRNSQRSLTESEEKFRVLYEMAGDAIILTKPLKGEITDTNEVASKMLGYTKQEFNQLTVYDIIAPEAIEKSNKTWQEQLTKKGNYSLETLWVRKDGTRVPVAVTGNLITIQGIEYIQSISRDISDQKEAEKEIQRLANFPTKNPQPVLEIDGEGVLTYINPTGKQLLNEMGNGLLDKILPLNFRQGVIDSLKSGETLTHKTNVLGERTFLWSAHFLPELELVHIYANDITELKQKELDLIKAKNKAEQADQVKSLFLANMSHEIRTPLNSLMGFTDLIEQRTRDKLGDEYLSFFDILKSSGQRLVNTVHKILDISQIEAGTYELDPKPLDLRETVSMLVTEIEPIAAKKALTLHWPSFSKPAMVMGDIQSVSQAITYLLDNAIKYTNEGNIDVLLSENNHQFQLVIQDTGIGMSPEYLDHIYDTFSQESTGYTKKFQGIGLGLALVKRFLDLNKVDLKVKSKKGIGTTFTLLFQKAPDNLGEIGL